MATTNLDISYIDSGVADKTSIANTAFDDFDSALAGHDATTWTFPSDAHFTPTAADCLRALSFVIVTGSLASAKDLIVPSNPKLYFVYNSTVYTVTVKVTGQTGVAVTTLKRAILYCDGTDVRLFAALI